MRKDILAKAIRLADKSKARPDKVVIGKPASAHFSKKPPALVRSERLHTRLTKSEMKRLKAHLGKPLTLAELARDIVIEYLDNTDRKHGRKKT